MSVYKNTKFNSGNKELDKRINRFLDKYYMKDKGFFLFKKRWHPFCSSHQEYKHDCALCNVGSWHNIFIGKIESLIYKISPSLYKKIMSYKKVNLEQIDENKRRNKRKNKKRTLS